MMVQLPWQKKLDKENTLSCCRYYLSIRFTIGKNASIQICMGGFCKIKQHSRTKFILLMGILEQTKDENVGFMETVWTKTFYFGVPIPKEYHSTDNAITLDTIDTLAKLLTDVISWYQ